VVRTDNIGLIIMSENASTGFRTRHLDTRHHFVREFVEDDFIVLEISFTIKYLVLHVRYYQLGIKKSTE
jgi:hypothetical protein